MPAYMILDIEVTDPAGFEQYKRAAPPALAVYGGNIWRVGVEPRRSKAIGFPTV